MKKKFVEKGFTLVELLVTTVIIALLGSAALVSFRAANKQARDNRRNTDIQSIRAALEIYRTDCGAYPTTMPNGIPPLASPLTGSGSCSGNTYMEKIPSDPKSASYKYLYRLDPSDSNKYYLCSGYEILPSVEPAPTITAKCNSAWDCGAGGQSQACLNVASNP